jgi:hypothetical protein
MADLAAGIPARPGMKSCGMANTFFTVLYLMHSCKQMARP